MGWLLPGKEANWELKFAVGRLAWLIHNLSLDPAAGREWSALRRSCVTKIYANVPLHMLILHIYIKLNRLLHCFLTSASIHDYLFRFLCKMAYKHGAGILSACQWVCFQWRAMALIIMLILQGLHQECSPKRLQLTCGCVHFPQSLAVDT